MNPLESLRVAGESLRANRLRSLLTMVGVIIGVAAVVVLVAIGGGARNMVENEVEGLGSNIILVVPGKFSFGTAPSLSRLQMSDIDLASRVVGSPDDVTASIASGENVRSGGLSYYATVQGLTQTVPNVFNRPIAEGGVPDQVRRGHQRSRRGARCGRRLVAVPRRGSGRAAGDDRRGAFPRHRCRGAARARRSGSARTRRWTSRSPPHSGCSACRPSRTSRSRRRRQTGSGRCPTNWSPS